MLRGRGFLRKLLSFSACFEDMGEPKISALPSSPTVAHDLAITTADEKRCAIFSRVSEGFVRQVFPPCHSPIFPSERYLKNSSQKSEFHD
jgi:hypothetical protein